DHIATPGDYVIRGVEGEHYPVKPSILEATSDVIPVGGGGWWPSTSAPRPPNSCVATPPNRGFPSGSPAPLSSSRSLPSSSRGPSGPTGERRGAQPDGHPRRPPAPPPQRRHPRGCPHRLGPAPRRLGNDHARRGHRDPHPARSRHRGRPPPGR